MKENGSQNWQQLAAEFAEKHNLNRPVGVYALDLTSEVGEVAKEILRGNKYGQQSHVPTAELAAELGDVMYSLCMLATAAHIDLDTALKMALEKYATRFAKTDQIGS